MLYQGKDLYEGQFDKGKPIGKGLMICGHDDQYEGEFKDAKYGGQGTLTRGNMTYKG